MSQDQSIEITVAGHICLDISPDFSQIKRSNLNDILTPGKLINVGDAIMTLGGVVPNTGMSLTALGVKTALTAKLGQDTIGEIILSKLNQGDASVEIKTVAGESSSYSVVLNIPGFDRIFLHNPGANNTYTADDVDFCLVKKSKLFHFGYPTLMKNMYENDGEELKRLYKKAKETGTITSMDMALPDAASPAGQVDYRKVLANALPYVDVYVPSLEETILMLHRDEYLSLVKAANGKDLIKTIDLNILPRLGKELIDMGVKVLVIKCGSKGYYVKTGNREAIESIGLNADNFADREFFEETYHVEDIKSTTGAGDVSIAAFLASLIRGYKIEDCARLACATASLTISRPDVLSGIQPLPDTLAYLQTWEHDRITIDGDDFVYDEAEKIWWYKTDSHYNK